METMVSTAGTGSSESIGTSDELLPGVKAGPWIVERELGRGGMGAVYAVVHETIGKRAALKLIHQRLLASDFNSERMLLEARVVNQIGHPNIVDVFEIGKLADGRPYIVMERLAGQSLSDTVDDGKLLPHVVIAILLQVCDALIAAHAAGVVHRDLKLDNVFLVDNPDDPATPKIKLLDWGIAKVLSDDVKHTIEGQVVGTPRYLAPEQARGLPVSPQTDVYSLGVMAYELFLGQVLFEAETAAEVMAMHLRQPPPRPRALWPDIPAQLEKLLLAMLAKQPDQRPTMLEVARRLEAVRDELARSMHRAWSTPPRSNGVSSSPKLSRMTSSTLQSGTRPWQYAVGTAALIAAALLFWISQVSDRTSDAGIASADDLRPVHGELLLVALPEHGETAAAQPSTVEVRDMTSGSVAADDGARPAMKLAAASPTARARPTRRARTSASHAAPSHKPVLAASPGAKIHPDGTLEPYR
jgi:serine/threonine protein kinase